MPVDLDMGKKLLLIGSGVSLVATVGYSICLFLPLHKVYWKAGGFLDAVTMTIYSMSVHYDWKMTRACKIVRIFTSKKDLCDKDVDGESASSNEWLQDSSSLWCSDAIRPMIHGACEGMKHAYIMGILLLLFIIANFIMQGVGLFLIKEYLKKPKKQYREVAFFLDLIGGVLMLVSVILYWPITILQLDSMQVLANAGGLFGLSDSVGTSWGYIFMYFFIIIQAVSIVLLANGSNSAEAREMELREHKKFLREQELFQQVEMSASNYGGNVGVSAPPNHWGQGVQEQNWGAPQAGPQTNQAYPNYGYGGQPMAMSSHGQPPPMPASQSNMPPHMASAPPMQQPGGPVPYF